MTYELVVRRAGLRRAAARARGARAGLRVVGFDVRAAVVDGLTDGRSHIDDVTDAEIAELIARRIPRPRPIPPS